MTIPATPFRKDHTGNGTTGPYLYDWKIESNTHLRIIRTVIATGIETLLVLGVDYSVTGVGNPSGGNVNLSMSLPNTEKITILPNVPYEQDTDFTNQNSVKPQSAEDMADKLSRQIKQIAEKLSRAVTLPESDTGSPINYITQMNQIYQDTIAAKNTTENARDTVLNNAGFIVVSADLLGSNTIGTVAADITNVNTAAGSIANINTVAGSIASVNIVAADIANVNTVATDIASVNSAAANMAAIIAAPTQAANAASSAALSQSWAVGVIGARPEGSAKYWSEVAQGFAAAINLPSAVGNALRFLRQNADETGFEYRTAAQVRSDIGAATSAQGAKADTALQPDGDGSQLTGITGRSFAFVNWDAMTAKNVFASSAVRAGGTGNWSFTTTTPHNLKVGHAACISAGSWGAGVDVLLVTGVTSSTEFTAVGNSGPALSGTCAFLFWDIREARGVDSVVYTGTVGDSYINFSETQPNTNYQLIYSPKSDQGVLGRVITTGKGIVPAFSTKFALLSTYVPTIGQFNINHNTATFMR